MDDCSGIESAIKKNILEAAKAAIGNDKLTVTYAQRDKVVTPEGGNTTSAEQEDNFTYNAATSAKAGDISFKLEIKSTTGRTVTYELTSVEIAQTKAELYFDTADKAKAAVEKAVVTSGDTDTEQYDVLKATLISANVENTQESVEAAVKNALKEDALKTNTILGWTAENITVTYTPAQPDAGETKNPGKVSITADIVLKGDPSNKTTLTVTNAEVVDWDDSFQTAAQLKAAIVAEAKIEVAADNNLPKAAENDAQTKIETLVNGLKTGTGLTVEYDYEDAAFTANTEAKTAEYKDVKIVIKKGGKTEETVTVTFEWSVIAPEQGEGNDNT